MKHAKGGFLTIALFAAAATLLCFSAVGSSQAALQYTSKLYKAQVQMQDIGVTLLENGEPVSSRDYLGSNDEWSGGNGVLVAKMLDTGKDGTPEGLKLGRAYREELAVRNSGTIDEYVRVTIYRYWADGSGKKIPSLNSGLIKLHLTLGDDWYEDESSRTEERTVLYYRPILASGDTTPAFSDTLEIDDEGIEAEVTKEYSTNEAGETVITTTYTYNGCQFVLRADVDAVQTNNASDAKMSAWGTLG